MGAALRAWEYFGGASLWLNEIAVARNVLDRSALDLVSRPLDYDQSAPPAYLLATKLATALLGDGELAFRLPRSPYRWSNTRPKPSSTASTCSARSS